MKLFARPVGRLRHNHADSTAGEGFVYLPGEHVWNESSQTYVMLFNAI